MIRAFDASGRTNQGHALETAVLNELDFRGAEEIAYVKTPGGKEVEFLVRYLADGEELIQVCADLSAPATLAREMRALGEAGAGYPRATRRLLTLNRETNLPSVPAGTIVQPAYEWMLAPDHPSSHTPH